jgi:hypothetical protein
MDNSAVAGDLEAIRQDGVRAGPEGEQAARRAFDRQLLQTKWLGVKIEDLAREGISSRCDNERVAPPAARETNVVAPSVDCHGPAVCPYAAKPVFDGGDVHEPVSLCTDAIIHDASIGCQAARPPIELDPSQQLG